MLLHLLASFSVGFIGSLHCLGMCGPLVLAYSLHITETDQCAVKSSPLDWKNGVWHHLAFHVGRITTYGLLGALAATIFHVADFGQFVFRMQGGMTLLGGFLMVLMGLALLHVLPLPACLNDFPARSDSLWSRSIPRLIKSRHIGSKMLLGLATGFLPCGLSWAMIISAAATQDSLVGLVSMAAFGLGTVPALFLIGFSASVLSIKIRVFGERAAAVSVVAMGMILIVRGMRAIA